MKKVCLFAFFLSAAFAVQAVDLVGLHFDITGGFNGADVKVFVDGKNVYELKNAVVNKATGLSGSAEIRVADGFHMIYFTVDGKKLVTCRIKMHKETYTGIGLDPEKKPVLTIQGEPILYD